MMTSGEREHTDKAVLVTGASGFIGVKVVETLLRYGHSNVRCLVRRSSRLGRLNAALGRCEAAECVTITWALAAVTPPGFFSSRALSGRGRKRAGRAYQCIRGTGAPPIPVREVVLTVRIMDEICRQIQKLDGGASGA